MSFQILLNDGRRFVNQKSVLFATATDPLAKADEGVVSAAGAAAVGGLVKFAESLSSRFDRITCPNAEGKRVQVD